MANLIFTDKKSYYALTKDGVILSMPNSGILEISDDKSLLEIRKSQWEKRYQEDPERTVRPPWIEGK